MWLYIYCWFSQLILPYRRSEADQVSYCFFYCILFDLPLCISMIFIYVHGFSQGNFCSMMAGNYKLIFDNSYANFFKKVSPRTCLFIYLFLLICAYNWSHDWLKFPARKAYVTLRRLNMKHNSFFSLIHGKIKKGFELLRLFIFTRCVIGTPIQGGLYSSGCGAIVVIREPRGSINKVISLITICGVICLKKCCSLTFPYHLGCLSIFFFFLGFHT